MDAEDSKALAKKVQLYEALGKIKERDAAREDVFKLFKAGKIAAKFYCREQFNVGKTPVIVFEYFELKGERALRYSFQVLDEKGDSAQQISLGSYEMTTLLAREQGQIKADERMYHLDQYTPQSHATLGMFKKEPTYEETRQQVIAFIEGKVKPMSSTTLPPAKEKP
jgi:hypothetical protein